MIESSETDPRAAAFRCYAEPFLLLLTAWLILAARVKTVALELAGLLEAISCLNPSFLSVGSVALAYSLASALDRIIFY